MDFRHSVHSTQPSGYSDSAFSMEVSISGSDRMYAVSTRPFQVSSLTMTALPFSVVTTNLSLSLTALSRIGNRSFLHCVAFTVSMDSVSSSRYNNMAFVDKFNMYQDESPLASTNLTSDTAIRYR